MSRSSAMIRYKRVASARRKQLADGLIRAALFALQAHKQNLNRSNPRPYLTPSRAGEYPRKRTGFGQSSFHLSSTNAAEIAALLTPRVLIGIDPAGNYLETHLIAKGRKGLADTMRDTRAQVRGIVERAVK